MGRVRVVDLPCQFTLEIFVLCSLSRDQKSNQFALLDRLQMSRLVFELC